MFEMTICTVFVFSGVFFSDNVPVSKLTTSTKLNLKLRSNVRKFKV